MIRLFLLKLLFFKMLIYVFSLFHRHLTVNDKNKTSLHIRLNGFFLILYKNRKFLLSNIYSFM